MRGEGRFHHFELEPKLERDLDPAFLALHKRIAEQSARILCRGTEVGSYNDPRALAERGERTSAK